MSHFEFGPFNFVSLYSALRSRDCVFRAHFLGQGNNMGPSIKGASKVNCCAICQIRHWWLLMQSWQLNYVTNLKNIRKHLNLRPYNTYACAWGCFPS